MVDARASDDVATVESVIAYALAVGEACREAEATMNERYVIDEGARLKLMALVVKIAEKRMRSGDDVLGEVATIAHLAVQRLLSIRSDAPLIAP